MTTPPSPSSPTCQCQCVPNVDFLTPERFLHLARSLLRALRQELRREFVEVLADVVPTEESESDLSDEDDEMPELEDGSQSE